MILSNRYFCCCWFFSILKSQIFYLLAPLANADSLNSKVPHRRAWLQSRHFIVFLRLTAISFVFSELWLLSSAMLMLTSIANFTIQTNIATPDQSSLIWVRHACNKDVKWSSRLYRENASKNRLNALCVQQILMETHVWSLKYTIKNTLIMQHRYQNIVKHF